MVQVVGMQEQQQQVQQAQAEAAAARSKAADAGRTLTQAQHELHQLHEAYRYPTCPYICPALPLNMSAIVESLPISMIFLLVSDTARQGHCHVHVCKQQQQATDKSLLPTVLPLVTAELKRAFADSALESVSV